MDGDSRVWDEMLVSDDENQTIVKRILSAENVVARERHERHGQLLHEYWYDDDGSRIAVVTPTAKRFDGPPSDFFAELRTGERSEGKPIERWRAFDNTGKLIAEGELTPGGIGRPIGDWTVFDADGVPHGTVAFEEFNIHRNAYLGFYARALFDWRAAAPSPLLADVHSVDWKSLASSQGSGQHVPFLLQGLLRPDTHAFNLALSQLHVLMGKRGTVYEVSGHTLRYMTRLWDHLEVDDDARQRMLTAMIEVATGGVQRGLIRMLIELYPGALANVDPRLYFMEHDVDPDYIEVCAALVDGIPTWERLAAHQSVATRRRAVVLLAATPHERAVAVLQHRLATEDSVEVRAEILVGLALRNDITADVADALRRHLTDPEPLLRFCAAIACTSCGLDVGDAALGVFVAVLRGEGEPLGYDELFLGRDEPAVDAIEALSQLSGARAEAHLPLLCEALGKVHPAYRSDVMRVLLDIVFPTHAYQKGSGLTDTQRAVVHAIAGDLETFAASRDLDAEDLADADVADVLRANGLPKSATKLRKLAKKAPVAGVDAATNNAANGSDHRTAARDAVAAARAALSGGKAKRAAPHLAEAFAHAPDLPDAHHALADLVAAVGAKKAVKLFPLEPSVFVGVVLARAHALAAAGSPDEALELLFTVSGQDPTRPWADAPWVSDPRLPRQVDPDHLSRLCMHFATALPDPVDAEHRPALRPILTLARNAVAVHGEDFKMLIAASGLGRRLGADRDATAWATTAERLAPSLATATMVALCHRSAGRVDEALAAFERALMFDPRDTAVLTDVAEMLAFAGRLDEALTWVERALEMNPDDPAAFPTACALRFRRDSDPTHIAALRDYIRRHPGNAHAERMLMTCVPRRVPASSGAG